MFEVHCGIRFLNFILVLVIVSVLSVVFQIHTVFTYIYKRTPRILQHAEKIFVELSGLETSFDKNLS